MNENKGGPWGTICAPVQKASFHTKQVITPWERKEHEYDGRP